MEEVKFNELSPETRKHATKFEDELAKFLEEKVQALVEACPKLCGIHISFTSLKGKPDSTLHLAIMEVNPDANTH